VLVLEPAAPPDPPGPAYAVSRADQMAIVKPSHLGLDHIANAAPRMHEVVDVAPAGPPTADTNVQHSPAGPLSTRQTAFSDSTPTSGGAKLRALSRPPVKAGGPIVAPRSTHTGASLKQPETGQLSKCSEFLESGGWAIQDSNLGPLPDQE